MARSSTFNSDDPRSAAAPWQEGLAPREGAFFPRALAILLLATAVAFGAAHLAGRAYRPQALSPSPDRVRASDHFFLLFGNSRFEAGIDPELLSKTLSQSSDAMVDAQMFSGGGWDSIHYYMLALLARDALRPGRDGVIIEVSPLSLNDAETDNRINAVRAEVSAEVANLPGAPIEDRLKILAGGVAGLYRYRLQFQSKIIYPRVDAWLKRVGARLEKIGIVRSDPVPLPFQIVFAPGREFIVQEVRGDLAAFTKTNREKLVGVVQSVQFGGYKYRALEKAVRVLREKGVAVYLVQTPTSHWFAERLLRTSVGATFRAALRQLAESTGARTLTDWPASYYGQDRFWDETHMVADATAPFTAALAERLLAHVGARSAKNR